LSYTRIPVVAEARADLYTPLALYLKLANTPYSYLLESVVGGERFGRYSFIGLACAERIEAKTTARGCTVRRLLRDAAYTEARDVMTGQLGSILARIHALDWRRPALSFPAGRRVPPSAVRRRR